MSIKAAWRADAIRFNTTSKGSMEACGGGGENFPQNIGNGTLVGFWGRADSDVNALGSIFKVWLLSTSFEFRKNSCGPVVKHGCV